MKRFIQFISYHNAVPIFFGILFLGGTLTFAATEDVQKAVVSSQSVVTQVDNSYLLETEITDDVVYATITSVTEDDVTYYVNYDLTTIEVRDGVWQPVVKSMQLMVSKDSVVSRDLGLYAEEEIAEVHAAEIRLLQETQANERRAGESQKVVTTEYEGLIGQFFDPTAEAFPTYTPVIDPEIGIPLTREQERAHETVRRLLEAERQQPKPATQSPTVQTLPPNPIPPPPTPEPDVTPSSTTPDTEPSPSSTAPVVIEPTPTEPSPEASPTEPLPEPEPEPDPEVVEVSTPASETPPEMPITE